MSDSIPWSDLADVYGFIGNSLLKPMTQTATVGLEPEFWAAFPDFGDEGIGSAVARCENYAASAVCKADAGSDAVETVSVEFTRLFIGPPSPAAAPWETMYRAENVTVGFGQPTFEMREILREAGLELSNENHQYEDHMGIELLYLSTRCTAAAADDSDSTRQSICAFIEQRPLSWIDSFRSRVEQAAPDGYFGALLALAESVLVWHAGLLHE